MSSKKVLICEIAFMVGIVLAEILELSLSGLFLILFIPLFIISTTNKKLFFIVLIIFCLILGYWRFDIARPKKTPTSINYYNNSGDLEWSEMQSTIWQGKIIREIDQRVDHNKLTVASQAIFIESNWQIIEGLVLVKADLYPSYQYGDILQLECNLVEPTQIEDFAYDDYLSRYNIYSLCYGAQIKYLDHDDSFNLKVFVLNIKNNIQQKLNHYLVEPEASLLSAMLLANRRGLPTYITDSFSRAGVSHLIAISGMHIAIISLLIARFLSVFGLSKKITYPATLSFLFLYIAMIGWPASAVRAGIMGAIVLIAEYFGRVNKSYYALFLVASITLLINPKLIVYDIGWQLSFLAVLSLILFSDDLTKLFSKLPKLFGAKEILQTTLAAQILTLPWLAYKFHQLSLVFPIANILLLPFLPFIMGLSIISIVISFVLPQLANFLFWGVWLLLNKQIGTVLWLTSIRLAAIKIPKVEWFFIFFIYCFIFILKFKKNKKAYEENS